MYVSKKDLNTISDLRSQIQDLIENGAEGEYWFDLHQRTCSLEKKMIRQSVNQNPHTAGYDAGKRVKG